MGDQGGTGAILRRQQDQAVDHRVVDWIVSNQGDVIMERSRSNPGIGCLDRAPFFFAEKVTSAHLTHNSRLTGRTT